MIKVTNFCSMGCSHCMENSTRLGTHMSRATFSAALSFQLDIEAHARKAGYSLTLLSGGECTEHPDIVELIEETYKRGLQPYLITNGMWLKDRNLRSAILRPEWRNLRVQVTNDSRFYPTKPPKVDDPRITYVDSLTAMVPLGRFINKVVPSGLRMQRAPASFNIRSMTRAFNDVRKAVALIRLRALVGLSGHCAPSISDNGDFMAGETRNCGKVGTVYSTAEEVTQNLIDLKCNNCGLVNNLDARHRHAIGM